MKSWNLADDDLLVSTFPIDPDLNNYVREVKEAVFSIVKPISFKTPLHLVAYSKEVLEEILDMDLSIVDEKDFLDFVSGTEILKGSTPLSHRYGGHQFGIWADQLGDGRAVLLGEYVNRKGERWELQLKGSGKTPYSRQGDGRAVLRSSVREFLCSEAMYHLGIPTSRAATLVTSSDPVMRDQFYDGHPKAERGAVVLRLAPSWFRIGSLEILESNKEFDLLRRLTDFVIKQHFPQIDMKDNDRYLSFFSHVVSQTAYMIASWQSVGFSHGVCNTDNFSLLSITIDYGPFGFLDAYVPNFVPNSSDDEGMYSYDKQPDVGYFNLDKLRIALMPLLTTTQNNQMKVILQGYVDIYKENFLTLLRNKLGLAGEQEQDEFFLAVLLKIMEETKSDFTMTFRNLGDWKVRDMKMYSVPDDLWALHQLENHKYFKQWVKMYVDRIEFVQIPDEMRMKKMKNTNPRYILRNWIAQTVIEQAENDYFEGVRQLLTILQNPYVENEYAEKMGYASQPPKWASSLKVSCSS
ncbi:uncharacterized protein LOC106152576 [Lingula anatina]|uniref:Selenoprotein O n=1 Tax=Lingula anatina TaxID=7574 RepID=A0A1S3H6B2_LINAN|nr:uncharacterized protein LOC106152576 [Lingula anatina]|eukprot:XP_013381655.1 uncharacterized protein LOC106152576 [Lingula anatina]